MIWIWLKVFLMVVFLGGMAVAVAYILVAHGSFTVMTNTVVKRFEKSRGGGPFFGECFIEDGPYIYCAVKR